MEDSMANPVDDVPDIDIESSSLDELKSVHQSLENRLDKLESPRSMSPEEEYEMNVIKKRKLSIKDKILDLEEE
jgi:hypothetical protein